MLIIVCSLISTGAVIAEDVASVKIVVSDYFGSRLNDVVIKLANSGKVTTTRSDVPLSLPYGEYRVSLSEPGFGISDYIIKVDQPQQIFMLAMKLGGIEGPDPVCSIKGSIISTQAVARLRLIAIFSSYLTDVAVSQTGLYVFKNIQCGDYFVMAFDSKGCIGAQRISVIRPESLANLRFDAQSRTTGCPLPKQ
jgi:hypothetical protein